MFLIVYKPSDEQHQNLIATRLAGFGANKADHVDTLILPSPRWRIESLAFGFFATLIPLLLDMLDDLHPDAVMVRIDKRWLLCLVGKRRVF